jgi:hypothetical protein
MAFSLPILFGLRLVTLKKFWRESVKQKNHLEEKRVERRMALM